jgi:signal-transduction protein with cAMP-binding, CBS, and nucleotidyltransferase domain
MSAEFGIAGMETIGYDETWDLQSRAGRMMSGPPVFVEQEATLREASEAMADECVGSLVLGTPRYAFGIVTEGDIVRALADGADPDEMRVADVVSSDLISVEDCDSVAQVISVMAEWSIRHVPVVSNGAVVGMISARDIVRGLAPTGA